MPKFTPDPTKATAGFEVYPKGSGYEFDIGEPKPFFKAATKPGKADNHGIRFLLICQEAPDNPAMKGKKLPVTLYLHTPESENMSKQFQIAALGAKNDVDFNERFGSMDWGYDPDDASCGDGWRAMQGRRIMANIDVKPSAESPTGEQNTFQWRAV